MRAQLVGQEAKLRALDEQVLQKQGEADEATAGISKLQASLPWLTQETNIRRQAKELKYGNQVAWVEAERSLAEEQHELGVLARHRERAMGRDLCLHTIRMIDGRVIALSRDAVVEAGGRRNPEPASKADDDEDGSASHNALYVAHIALDRSYIDTEAGRMTLGAGMAVTAGVYTGKRRITNFLLSPLQRLAAESGHER